jgi:nucleolar GTP-binding protein
MNFQDLKTVEKSQFYLDVAFKKASKKASVLKNKRIKDQVIKSRVIEQKRIQIVKDTLTSSLGRIITGFPNFDNLPEFYDELVKVTLDYEAIKKALASVNWAKNKTQELSNAYLNKIRFVKEKEDALNVRKQYYGRVSSVIARIDSHLATLENARKVMKSYPNIKTSVYTVAIAGFPNVGKSTLLSKLTTSKPEIKEYAFTTKKLNIGYLNQGDAKIQFVDTPGTLNRFDKMNAIEKQAFLAIKYVADMIIYVLDLTEPFPLEDQEKLLEKLRAFDKEIILYLSKTDILDAKLITKFKEKYAAVISPAGLKDVIIKKAKD